MIWVISWFKVRGKVISLHSFLDCLFRICLPIWNHVWRECKLPQLALVLWVVEAPCRTAVSLCERLFVLQVAEHPKFRRRMLVVFKPVCFVRCCHIKTPYLTILQEEQLIVGNVVYNRLCSALVPNHGRVDRVRKLQPTIVCNVFLQGKVAVYVLSWQRFKPTVLPSNALVRHGGREGGAIRQRRRRWWWWTTTCT